MLFDFSHGGHAIPDKATLADSQASPSEAGTEPKSSDVTTPETSGEDFDPDSMTRFRFLSEGDRDEDKLPVSPATVEALDELGNAMVDQPVDRENPDTPLPPVFTYWAQFIDHELTARTDRDTKISDITLDANNLTPAPRQKVEDKLFNRRTPTLELDCIYGDRRPPKITKHNREKVDHSLRMARKLRDGAKMRIGTAFVQHGGDGRPAGAVPPPDEDISRDLPRIGQLLDTGIITPEEFPDGLRALPTFRHRAFIGDPRNDENLVVAQFHLAILRFHNAVVDWLLFKDNREERRDTEELFRDARKIVTWTFQWLVVNQFLKQITSSDLVDQVLAEGAPLYRRGLRSTTPPNCGMAEPYMPVEFSVACYRFGHSMIRNTYDYNRNFGRKPDDLTADNQTGFIAPNAQLSQFFLFTGKSANSMNASRQGPGREHLPHNWIIEWDRFDGTGIQKSEEPALDEDGNQVKRGDVPQFHPSRLARKIDTRLANFLGVLDNEDAAPSVDQADLERVRTLLKHLARRNLRRGYQLSLPTGQALAQFAGVTPLTPEQLSTNNTQAITDAMTKGQFFKHTPLWFYVLKEAEVQNEGKGLGELGSRIVANTFIGVLLNDPHSYLSRDPDWDPSKMVPGAGGPLTLKDGRTISEIADLFEFAGVKPPKTANT